MKASDSPSRIVTTCAPRSSPVATTDDARLARVLAKQPIEVSKPHPFVQAGNREFNTFVWIPPSGARAGDVLFADSTVFNTLFGGDASLERFRKNLARVARRILTIASPSRSL
jgi:hypothetical protein